MRTHTVVDSPLGPLLVVAQDGALVQLGPLADGAAPTSAWGPALDVTRVGERDDDTLPGLRAELDGYWAGSLRDFTVDVAPPGTPFQQRVWAALRSIPYGETWSYTQLAERIGSPTAVRAVGAANGRNPVFLVVPCHRVIGSSGKLVGYAGGLDRKRWLLDHERAAAWVASG